METTKPMNNLFHIPDYKIDTSKFGHLLHDKVVNDFEEEFKQYVGAKYACTINSATNAIFLLFLDKKITVEVPSMIPPVVCNGLLTSGNNIRFVDNVEWVGNSYTLHDFGDYKVIDSAQKVVKEQFKLEANEEDIMFFSFYPTKPIGSADGGIVVSNDEKKIRWLKEATLNGMTYDEDNWNRRIKFPGYKMYMNSFQAFIAMQNLKVLDSKNKRLHSIKEYYNSELNLNNSSYHLYRINVSNRQEFMRNMKESGFQTGVHYAALHLNSVYATEKVSLPQSEAEAATTVSICYNEAMTDETVEENVRMIKKYADIC